MLTGAILPSAGRAFLGGFDVVREQRKADQNHEIVSLYEISSMYRIKYSYILIFILIYGVILMISMLTWLFSWGVFPHVEVRRLLGYCPQHDALLDRLTVREHLELFGRIKGIPKEVLRTVCDQMMQERGFIVHISIY